jgi:lantibiotic biosynthesis protein
MKKATHTYSEIIDKAVSLQEADGTGVINGHESKLLYYYEQFRATGGDTYKDELYKACSILSAELRDYTADVNHSLSGMAGILWLYCELKESGFDVNPIGTDTTAINAQLANDALLYMDNRQPGYMEGTYGILYYLLLCEQTQTVKGFVMGIINKITDSYIAGDTYNTFKHPDGEHANNGVLDLGLYNGLCGNLMVLLRACHLGYNRQNVAVEKLLKEGVGFILHHKMDIDYEDECYSFFPPAVKRSSNFLETSNSLSWANSDLNHIMLLYEMHLLTGERQYKDMADHIGLQTIARKQFEETQVANSSIINGSAGIAMFYKKLSTYSNTREYTEAFHYWIERTLTQFKEDMDNEKYKPGQLGLLDGLTGVSLSLLSYSSEDVEPRWTKLFFL